MPVYFHARSDSCESRRLILDYDGTLAPFRIERMEAIPYDGVRELLATIIRLGGGVTLVSGRNASEVAELLDLKPTPEIWGCHGWERLTPSGRLDRIPLDPRQEEGLIRAAFTLKNEGWQDRLESKYGSLALHWRGASDNESTEIKRAGLRAMTVAPGADLALRQFDGGLELRALGQNKGSAVRTIVSESPYNTLFTYLGDDQTDEDAFEEVNKAQGVTILVRDESRPSLATGWIVPPDELLDFLANWKSACENDINRRNS